MELQVGMYVRGFRGINKIIKIEPYNDTFFYYTDGKEGKPFYFERHIKRSSFNPIDLIEVGDYVKYKQSNMYWNIPTRVSGRYNRQQQLTELMVDNTPLKNVEITSIVTKEQFQKMEYRTGE